MSTDSKGGTMFNFQRPGFLTSSLVLVSEALVVATAGPMNLTEVQFMAQNQAAMSKMMADMRTTPSGDVDHDFVAMMIPHHQGAIDMARAELRYGRNEQLRRIAQEIIVDQQQEITAMHMAVDATRAYSRATPIHP